MRAVCTIRAEPHYRRDAFESGLKACGYKLATDINNPTPADIFVCWNRGGGNNTTAKRFESAGARALIAENGYMGKKWNGSEWFAMSRGHHNGAGKWNDKGPDRWDSWNVELEPFRTGGTEVVLLPQRGIGEPGVAMPSNWTKDAQSILGRRARVRQHPGDREGVPMSIDLRHAEYVLTWGSGAGLKALAMGIPVFYSFPKWIGAAAARPLADLKQGPRRDPEARLAMFRRMAWAMWTLEEIASGYAFKELLGD